MKRMIAILVGVALVWAAARTRAAQSGGTYEVVVERDVMVPMRDGIRLDTDVYRPAKNGVAVTERLPMLLFRTPYEMKDSKVSWVQEAQWFTQHAYVVVMQNSR